MVTNFFQRIVCARVTIVSFITVLRFMRPNLPLKRDRISASLLPLVAHLRGIKDQHAVRCLFI